MTTNATLISFACQGCGRPFSVPANYAGRKATCKTCGVKVEVPEKAASASPPAPSTAANRNGKTPSAEQGQPAATASLSPGVENETDVPTSDPSVPPPRFARVAVISEAQSAPGITRPPEEGSVARAKRHALVDDLIGTPASRTKAAPRIPMRIRRLMVDAEQVAAIFSGEGPIKIKSAVGNPPELYQVEYKVTGLVRGWLGKPKKRETHLVEIQLTSEYPRVSPKCRMLTPVFHPNIDETTICVGDHWTAGERLVDLMIRIGQMLAYQDYNIKSPLNGEAAMWADLNPKKLPVDSRNLHLADAL